MSTQEEVIFELETAPEAVRIALRTAKAVVLGLDLEERKAAHLIPIIAGVHHVEVMAWLLEHGYMGQAEAQALSVAMVKFQLARSMADL
jgi:hypothetical protein